MRIFIFVVLLLIPSLSPAQSKSVTRFRSDFKESSNMFFYSSTLKMLNTDNNPEFAEILNGIEEIKVLNYTKTTSRFNQDDLAELKRDLQNEEYNTIMMVHEKDNFINVYHRERNGHSMGMVAIIENAESLVLIDLIGALDIKKFMELKHKLDSKSPTNL